MRPLGALQAAQDVPPGTILGFRLFGVPLRLHFTFVLLLVFLIVFGLGGQQSSLVSILYIAALLGSVLLHELAHAVVSRRFGIRTEQIILYPIGGLARLEREPTPKEDIWIAISGPVVNLLLAAGIFLFLHWRHALLGLGDLMTPTDANLWERIAVGNLILAGFNLLPAFPMDGGRVLRSILMRKRKREVATQMAAAAGRFLGISMGLYGLLTMHFLLVFVAFFVYLGAAQEGAAAMGRLLTQGIPVRDAMVTKFHTLTHGQTVGDAARLLLATAQQDFPILHGDEVTGLLGRNDLLRAMASAGPQAYVSEAMERDFVRLDPDIDLAETLPHMARAGTCALVMEGNRLLGLLTKENLSEYLVLRRFGMSPGGGAAGIAGAAESPGLGG